LITEWLLFVSKDCSVCYLVVVENLCVICSFFKSKDTLPLGGILEARF